MALPAWWDDEIAQNKSGLQQAQMYFARAFHIDLPSLAQSSGSVQFRETQRKFKLSRNVTEHDVTVSAHFATALAKLALVGFSAEQTAVPKDPVKLREAILAKHPCVNLSALLAWCATAHIPVLHIDKLPGKKMTGLVVRDDGRYAIVLSKKGTPSHLLFHLAHELGHIAHGHLSGNGFVVDEKIGGQDAGDADEKEADAYAIRLLNGMEVSYRPGSKSVIKSGAALYKAALNKATQERIDVGHIILNFGNSQGNHALANMALKSIPGESDGIKVVNSAFFKSLDAEKLSEDQLELLKKATGQAL
jgi:IrrE N-terminal-like domain